MSHRGHDSTPASNERAWKLGLHSNLRLLRRSVFHAVGLSLTVPAAASCVGRTDANTASDSAGTETGTDPATAGLDGDNSTGGDAGSDGGPMTTGADEGAGEDGGDSSSTGADDSGTANTTGAAEGDSGSETTTGGCDPSEVNEFHLCFQPPGTTGTDTGGVLCAPYCFQPPGGTGTDTGGELCDPDSYPPPEIYDPHDPCGGNLVGYEGPLEAGGECCYVIYLDNTCCGRPFIVNETARMSTAVRREDWMLVATPDVSALDESERNTLAEHWTGEALAEHASVASFARFVMQLMTVGAPASLVEAAQRAMGDEIVHARMGSGLASTYAGHPLGPGPLPVDAALDDHDDLTAVTLAVVREGCVGETIAALGAMVVRDAATDPAVRRALDVIAADESRHSALAWKFLRWALGQGGAELAAEVAAAFAGCLAREDPSIMQRPPGELRAHGLLGRDEDLQLQVDGLRELVLPAARALLRVGGASQPNMST